MKVTYDKEVDIVYIQLNEKSITESNEDIPGIIFDYAEDDTVVGIEILNASSIISHPNVVEHEVA